MNLAILISDRGWSCGIAKLIFTVGIYILTVGGACSQSSITPSPSPAPVGLTLYHNWETSFQGGSETLKDLLTLIGPYVKAEANLAPDPTIEVYPGVPYLMPFKDAVKALGLASNLPSRNSVISPGFPRDSFFYYTFSGLFEGGFNQMIVVVDKADQVACIQLVAEAPNRALFEHADWNGPDKGYRTYNFVNYRNKATKKLKIDHQIDFYVQGKSGSHWKVLQLVKTAPKTPAYNELRIDSVLMDPQAKGDRPYSTETKPLEACRWYLPIPLAQTILYCVGKAGNSSTFGSN